MSLIAKIQEKRKKKLLLSGMFSHFSAIYLIRLADNTYEEIQAETSFSNLLPKKGMISDIYRLLFIANKTGIQNSGNYDTFGFENLFRRENCSGSLDLYDTSQKTHYDYYVFKMSENEHLLIFIQNQNALTANQYEKLKIDTLQENYLFSMIVDLKKDTCQNLVVPEVNASRQDYVNLKFTEWRLIISNMFPPDDKNMFLMLTEPEYIIKRLETEKLFKYEIRMLNLSGEYIWVRLRFNRLDGFSKDMPIFVYSVQDINSDMVHRVHGDT